MFKNRHFILIILAFSILFLFLAFGGVRAQTCEAASGKCYYVSPAGSASWPDCSNISTPCSVYTGVSNAAAGDIVYFRGGTYYTKRPLADDSRYNPALNPSNDGTAGNPITFKAYPGEDVIITYDSAETHRGPLIGSYRRDYITWDGFIVQEVAKNNAQDTGPVVVFGLSRGDVHDVTIINSDIRGVEVTLNPYSDNHNVIRIEQADNILIKNNKLHGIKGSFYNHAAIMIYFSDDVTIQNNEIYDNYNGIFAKGGDNTNVTIRYNLIHNGTVGIRKSFTFNSKVYQNIIYNMSSYGIQLAESTGTCANILANFDIFNNIIYNAYQGINMPGLSDRATGTGHDLRNNIISNTTYPMGLGNGCETNFQGDFAADYGNYFNYSAFRQGGTDRTFADWKAITGWDANSSTSNPLFVNVAAHDFHLQAGSPAINAGTDFGDLDGDGNTTERINIGAYATETECIGLLSNCAPIDGDTISPTVSITSPADGSTGSGAITISAQATDNVGINRVEFYINNVLKAADTTSPYTYSWDTASLTSGLYTIKATAYDEAGNTAVSQVSVNVVSPDTTPPSAPTGLVVQ